jgi:hypothetical protein
VSDNETVAVVAVCTCLGFALVAWAFAWWHVQITQASAPVRLAKIEAEAAVAKARADLEVARARAQADPLQAMDEMLAMNVKGFWNAAVGKRATPNAK